MFDDALRTQLLDVAVPHICQSRFAVGAQILLHLLDDVVDDVDVAAVQIQGFEHWFVALHQLGGSKADGITGSLCVVLDDVGNRVDGAVHFSLAEIQPRQCFVTLESFDYGVQQVRDALAFGSRDWNDRDAQLLRQLFDVDSVAAGAYLVHHVQRKDHRDVQLHQLKGQIQVAFQVGGIDDVDDGIGAVFDQKISGDHLLGGVRREGIDAGQVHQNCILILFDAAFFFFNRYARKVSDVLVAAGQRIKEGGFSTVLVAGKGKKMTHCVTSPISMLAASSARMVRT